ncbi:MAG: hypothetical protein H7248_09120 [Microbacteriaceae bacterium]|nr:hypothetical protein [Microbacteriaceae bacterium]
MNDSTTNPLERAKTILTESKATQDPAVSAAFAQAWALLAIAERLEELAEVTREVNKNPLALTAAPFANKPRAASPASGVTPGIAETAPVISRKRRPPVVLRVAP